MHHPITLVEQESARKVAARMLSLALGDAFTPGSKYQVEAEEWLQLRKFPSFEQIYKPAPLSFIYCCRVLGLNWYKTWLSAKDALAIPEPRRRRTVRIGRHGQCLKLVYNREP